MHLLPVPPARPPARSQFHEQALLAGLEGQECVMWRFEKPPPQGADERLPDPGTPARRLGLAGGGGAAPSGLGGDGGLADTGGAGSSAGGRDRGGRERDKKKAPKATKKQQTRYPKRSTK